HPPPHLLSPFPPSQNLAVPCLSDFPTFRSTTHGTLMTCHGRNSHNPARSGFITISSRHLMLISSPQSSRTSKPYPQKHPNRFAKSTTPQRLPSCTSSFPSGPKSRLHASTHSAPPSPSAPAWVAAPALPSACPVRCCCKSEH